MLRLNINSIDASRVRFLAAPAPLLEVTTSIRALQLAKDEERPSPTHSQLMRAFPVAAQPLLDLVPAHGFSPSFIEPLRPDLAGALKAVRETPLGRVSADLDLTFERRRPPSWVDALANGSRDGARQVLRALECYFMTCLRPYWPSVQADFEAEIAHFGQAQLRMGTGHAIEELHPSIRWQGDTLDVEAEIDREFTPGGLGLLLTPLAFWTGRPLMGLLPDGTALLAYASRGAPLRPAMPASDEDALAALVGRTRAKMLRTLVKPCYTSELAARVGMSSAVTSEHASVMRQAGLITSTRQGKYVRHALTRLGHLMLK